MRVFLLFLALCASSAADAAVYTLDPNSFAPGTNVTRRIPGVLLAVETVPVMPLSASLYTPEFTPLIVNTCLTSELCPKPNGKRKFGDAFMEGEAANECFTDPRGLHYPACSIARTIVLRAIFFGGFADFVSFNTSWWSDDPVLFAYDTTGRLVAECHTHLVPGLTDDCVRVTTGDIRVGFRTRISLSRPTADIYTVLVAGSFSSVRIGEIKFSIP